METQVNIKTNSKDWTTDGKFCFLKRNLNDKNFNSDLERGPSVLEKPWTT